MLSGCRGVTPPVTTALSEGHKQMITNAGAVASWRRSPSRRKSPPSSEPSIRRRVTIAVIPRPAMAVALVLCVSTLVQADMPSASLTPGAVAETDSRVVCAHGYASEHRKVPYAERGAVYREYGIPRGTRYASPRRGYRIDPHTAGTGRCKHHAKSVAPALRRFKDRRFRNSCGSKQSRRAGGRRDSS